MNYIVINYRKSCREFSNKVPSFSSYDSVFYDNRKILALASFLPRDAMCKRGLCCRPVSVRLSVTLVHCIQTAEDIVKLLSWPGSQEVILVF